MLTRHILPNLRTRLVAVIFLALLPAFVLVVTIAAVERSRAEESAKLESMALAQLLANQYQEVISNTERSLEWLARLPDATGPDPNACKARLLEFYNTSGQFLGLIVARPDGTVRCSATQDLLSNASTSAGQPFFERALATKAFSVGDVQIGQASKKPYLTVGLPVLDANGKVTAIIGAGLDIGLLAQRIANNQFYQYASLTLTDRDGKVVLRHPDYESFSGKDYADAEIYQIAKARQEGWAEAPGLTGSRRLFSFTTIGPPSHPDLYAFAGLTTDYIYAGVNRMMRLSLAGLAVIGLAALASAWISAEVMIVRRAERVVDAALRMRAGDFSARVGLVGDSSEMGQLAETFDSMAAALEERDAENARLISQMQQLNAELESRVIKRTDQLQISNSKLLETQADLRRLSEELMRSIELERTRISREIHDQLGQLLTAIKMELRTVEHEAARDPAKVSERLSETFELVDETIRSIRRIASDLRPGILDDFGLEAAVEWQLEQFHERMGLSVDLATAIAEDRVSKDMSTATFRIFQEALTNIARHAEATHVDVAVRTTEDELLLSVLDNGKGLQEQGNRRSLGMVGMRERARQLGGSVSVGNGPEQGVLVEMRLPLRQYLVETEPGSEAG
jgi:signal transduction histidine kinase